MAARKKTRKRTTKKRTVKKRRTAAQKAATAKLVALNKKRAKKSVKRKRATAKVVKHILGDMCFRTHEGKMYKVGKVTATCPPGFFHTRQ